jgi:hypothetical protein
MNKQRKIQQKNTKKRTNATTKYKPFNIKFPPLFNSCFDIFTNVGFSGNFFVQIKTCKDLRSRNERDAISWKNFAAVCLCFVN